MNSLVTYSNHDRNSRMTERSRDSWYLEESGYESPLDSICNDNYSHNQDAKYELIYGTQYYESNNSFTKNVKRSGREYGRNRNFHDPITPRTVPISRNNMCLICENPITSNAKTVLTDYGTAHFNCFVCYKCNCHLEHSEFYYSPEHNAFYCHLDYHEGFSNRCAHCLTPIEGQGIFALGKHWHEDHFFCSECSRPFDTNQEYLIKNDLPICHDCFTSKTAPKCWKCKEKLVGNRQAIEALDRTWCSTCFSCEVCIRPFHDGHFILRDDGTLVCTGCEERRILEKAWE